MQQLLSWKIWNLVSSATDFTRKERMEATGTLDAAEKVEPQATKVKRYLDKAASKTYANPNTTGFKTVILDAHFMAWESLIGPC